MAAPARFALRSLATQRAHAAVSVIGIALSCALITAILISVTSLERAVVRAAEIDMGTWEVRVRGLSDEGGAWIGREPGVRSMSTVREIGTAALTWGGGARARTDGTVTLTELPRGEAGVVPAAELFEGSLPASGNEVLLPRWLKGMSIEGGAEPSPLAVGSTVELALGRVAEADGDGSGREADAAPEVVDAGRARAFRVSGFYELGPLWMGDGPGGVDAVAFTAAGSGLPSVGTEAYLVMAETPSFDAVRETVRDIIARAPAGAAAPGSSGISLAELNSTILAYHGVPGDAPAWMYLWFAAGVLSLVVAAAGIALIGNAFAISVSERTRHFGLLASAGASAAQIGRIVLIEALILAAIGIPLGVAVGVGGAWTVFRFTGEGVAVFAGLGAEPLPISVSLPAIALAALVSLAATLAAAALPAWRAGRVSTVDAVREARGGAGRGGRRRGRVRGRVERLRLHLEGVSGWLAHRNLARASSRGRIAVVSLAISVVLIVSSGLLTSYLRTASSGVPEAGGADVSVSLVRARPGGDEATAAEGALRVLSNAGHVTRAGFAADEMACAIAGPGVIDPARVAEGAGADAVGGSLADGGWAGIVNLALVDEATWQGYLAENGLDAARFSDPDRPVAVGCNIAPSPGGSPDLTGNSPFAGGGTIRILTSIASRRGYLLAEVSSEDGEARAVYQPLDGDDGQGDGSAPLTRTPASVPLGLVLTGSAEAEVGAVAPALPWAASETNYYNQNPTLVLPLSALPALLATEAPEADPDALAAAVAQGDWLSRPLSAGDSLNNGRRIVFSLASDDPQATGEGVERALPGLLEDSGWSDHDVTNYAELFRQRRLSLMAIGTFTVCFAAITGLIAAANVFTTITTSIILRRREFAALRSIGMGEGAFRLMIAREAASYTVRGLLLGLAASAGVDFMLWQGMGASFGHIGPQTSLPMVAIAVGAVLALMVLSVLYALSRCRSESIIEAIRDDVT